MYKKTITIEKDLWDKAEKLLQIEDLNNLSEEEKLLNPNFLDTFNIFKVKFDNGYYIELNLLSGDEINSYYWDCSVLKNPDGEMVDYNKSPDYTLSGYSEIYYYYKGIEYLVIIEIK